MTKKANKTKIRQMEIRAARQKRQHNRNNHVVAILDQDDCYDMSGEFSYEDIPDILGTRQGITKPYF